MSHINVQLEHGMMSRGGGGGGGGGGEALIASINARALAY